MLLSVRVRYRERERVVTYPYKVVVSSVTPCHIWHNSASS